MDNYSCPVVGGKVKKPGKRGRKPAKIDLKAKLERSRQSARECRARKKLRYQYLEELVSSRERAICALREELEMYKQWCMAMDQGKIPSEIKALLTGEEHNKPQQNAGRHPKAGKTDANSNAREYRPLHRAPHGGFCGPVGRIPLHKIRC
uniref:cAMP-responsive element-binding protein-like 2 n=1 Tax=Jaculus jaculus TaxID=51337 RepID=A0A8C5KDH3_JACJA